MHKLTAEQRRDAWGYLRMGYSAFVIDQDQIVPALGEDVIERVLDQLDRVNRRNERISHPRRDRAPKGA